MGKLTTHVLDTYHGQPAVGITIDLWRIAEDDTRTHLQTLQTNADGRGNYPLLEGEALLVGEYELTFYVRSYFQVKIENADASPFLNIVPVRFTVFDAAQNYHVPLVTSPWAYSTYRGS
jgi:5-hydroxyisourate hydrolase